MYFKVSDLLNMLNEISKDGHEIVNITVLNDESPAALNFCAVDNNNENFEIDYEEVEEIEI